MHVNDYLRDVLVPGNVAVSRLRMNGLPMDTARMATSMALWEKQAAELERTVVEFGQKKGLVLKFSKAHALPTNDLLELLYGKGLGLPVEKLTPTKKPSTDDGALIRWGSVMNPRPGDDPIVTAILKLRSLNKAMTTYHAGFARARRADGACHPHFNWAIRTPRISSDNPNAQNIPERADKAVADEIKSWFVPRQQPAPTPEQWDPRIHGSCFRWDIAGAEAAVRAACLTALFCSQPDPVAWPYIRLGKDIHSKTASLIYGVPEGTYRKGSIERDAVGKNTFFAKQFGAIWVTVQRTVLEKARVWLTDDEAKKISDEFDAGYTGLVELYELDKEHLGKTGYCEDGYGRRRYIGLPQGVTYAGRDSNGKVKWDVKASSKEGYRKIFSDLEHRCHIAANTPTQGMNASDCLWMVALTTLGEYVELKVPPMWEHRGLLFPEAAGWKLNGGPGPGGKPLLAFYSNTVHDSGWLDSAPGRHLESAAKVIFRRCTALPMDWRLQTDVPYRIELKCGPDQGHLYDYNSVADKFGFERMPEL